MQARPTGNAPQACPHTVKTCKEAIFLNNAGCSLLEQGAFEDALATFRDAVRTASITDSRNLNVAEIVAQAKERLISTQSYQAHVIQQFDGPTPPFSILNLEDYRDFEFDEHTLVLPYHSLVCPVYLDQHHCGCSCCTGSYSHLESAVMTYNFGLSYACLSKCQANAETQHTLQCVALRLFDMSDAVLRICHEHGDRSHKEDCKQFDHQCGRILFVRIAVLHSWYQLLGQSERDVDIISGHHVLVSLLDLQATIRRSEQGNVFAPVQASAAAA